MKLVRAKIYELRCCCEKKKRMHRYGRDREGEKKSWLKSLVVARETETEGEKRRQAEREASANEDSKWN